MRISIRCLFAYFVTLLWLSVAQAAGASEISVLRAFNKNMTSFEAKFEQTIVDEKQNLLDKATGKMFLQRPGKFRWEYQQPYAQLIVSDGDKIWIYDQDLEQVTVKSLNAGIGNTPAMLLSSPRPLDEDFTVEDRGLDKKLHWVNLIPKEKDINFTSILLAFDKQGIRAMKMFDKLGQTTLIRFSTIRVNPNLSQQLFRFTPPPGVDVVGSDG